MKSRGKRILAALWVAGALAGLLAVVFLPGRFSTSDDTEVEPMATVVEEPLSEVSAEESLANSEAPSTALAADEGTDDAATTPGLLITVLAGVALLAIAIFGVIHLNARTPWKGR